MMGSNPKKPKLPRVPVPKPTRPHKVRKDKQKNWLKNTWIGEY